MPANTRETKRYSLSLSLILGASVLCVGLVPQPTIFVVAAALVVCILAAAVHYRKWRWVPSDGQESKMARLSVGCVTATTLALLLRGYPLSFVLTPLIGIAAIVGMNRELTTRGRLIGRSKG
ncbi:hypothetical protein [Paenarthrobacter sp. 4246]|uniref:hypothetical protein n=1 Tax=Paenarthrobacter sp. 4246 TaxID=3156456 RepID=UPI00339B565F